MVNFVYRLERRMKNVGRRIYVPLNQPQERRRLQRIIVFMNRNFLVIAVSLLTLPFHVWAQDRIEIVVVVPSSREKEQNWRYTFTRPAAHWFKLDFNDKSWKSGPGGFGNKG